MQVSIASFTPTHPGPTAMTSCRPKGGTAPEDHYPTLPLDEICALSVKDIAEDDAVLFLWVPSPMYKEANAVIDAWGFEYKASIIWDKVRQNFGHYHSVNHEFVLICTRGVCTPFNPIQFDSVVVEEKTEHSRKPAVIAERIDALYPDGARIELFCRGAPRPGWDAWGNESEPAQVGS